MLTASTLLLSVFVDTLLLSCVSNLRKRWNMDQSEYLKMSHDQEVVTLVVDLSDPGVKWEDCPLLFVEELMII